MNCLSCKFVFIDNVTQPVSKCRRFPPQHDFLAGYPNRIALYPTVKDGYFCGEYVPKTAVLDTSTPVECDDGVRVIRQRSRPKKAS